MPRCHCADHVTCTSCRKIKKPDADEDLDASTRNLLRALRQDNNCFLLDGHVAEKTQSSITYCACEPAVTVRKPPAALLASFGPSKPFRSTEEYNDALDSIADALPSRETPKSEPFTLDASTEGFSPLPRVLTPLPLSRTQGLALDVPLSAKKASMATITENEEENRPEPTRGPGISLYSCTTGACDPRLSIGSVSTQRKVIPEDAKSPVSTNTFGKNGVEDDARSPVSTNTFGKNGVEDDARSPVSTNTFGNNGVAEDARSMVSTNTVGNITTRTKVMQTQYGVTISTHEIVQEDEKSEKSPQRKKTFDAPAVSSTKQQPTPIARRPKTTQELRKERARKVRGVSTTSEAAAASTPTNEAARVVSRNSGASTQVTPNSAEGETTPKVTRKLMNGGWVSVRSPLNISPKKVIKTIVERMKETGSKAEASWTNTANSSKFTYTTMPKRQGFQSRKAPEGPVRDVAAIDAGQRRKRTLSGASAYFERRKPSVPKVAGLE